MKALELSDKLRQNGKNVLTNIIDKSFNAQMKMANKMGALNVIIIGENEIKGGFLTVKDLETGKQEERTEDELING